MKKIILLLFLILSIIGTSVLAGNSDRRSRSGSSSSSTGSWGACQGTKKPYVVTTTSSSCTRKQTLHGGNPPHLGPKECANIQDLIDGRSGRSCTKTNMRCSSSTSSRITSRTTSGCAVHGVCSAVSSSCAAGSFGGYTASIPAEPSTTPESNNNDSDSIDGERTCFGINGGNDASCDEHTWITYQIDIDGDGVGDVSAYNPDGTLNTVDGRSDCNISNWDSDNEATCDQTRTIISTIHKSYGPLDIITPIDQQRPGDGRTNTISLELDLDSSCSKDDTFGDETDTCQFDFDINTNITNLVVNGLVGQSVLSGSADFSDIATDITNSANKADVVSFNNYPYSIVGTPGNYNLTIDQIKSYIPFSENGDLGFILSGSNINFTDVPMQFRKPFVGSLTMAPVDEIILETWGTTTLNIDTAVHNTNTANTGLFHWKIENFTGTLIPTNANYSTALSGGVVNLVEQNPYIDTRIYLNTGAPSGESGLETNPYITYQLNGETVKYYLTPYSTPEGSEKIIKGEGGLQGVKIVGLYQGAGKLYSSAQDSNSSDITTVEYRNYLKRNAEIIIRDMTSGEVKGGIYYQNGSINSLYRDVNGIIYIDGNHYENIDTIIIENGNITIDGDIESGELLGIMVLGDYYTDNSKGNIFVDSNVQKINAAIFADGGFISTWGAQTDTVGYADSPSRTSALLNQLVLKGTLITRNTIGGALDAGDGYYTLPGGSHTDSNTVDEFNLAMMYDLNYIRRGSNYPVNSIYGLYPFVVVYDSRIQTAPPPGFTED